MSSRFSAQDYDDRPFSSPRSLVDLSPSSHSHTPRSRSRARARSGSLGAVEPMIPTQSETHYSERSNMRINTDLTVRAHNTTRQNIHFQRQLLIEPSTPTSGTLPSLAPTRKIALAYDNDSQVRPLAAFDRCAIVPRTFYFHLGSRDCCRHKSARRARLFLGYARRP